MFNGLTNIGKEYIAKCLAENKPITFTKVKIGDGLLDLNENAELLTDIKSLKKEVEILDKTQEGEMTTLTILLDNADLEVGYYPREIGIYVQDNGVEKLYWYINDGVETQWLCAANKYPIKFKQAINLMTTNLETVIINWTGKGLFVDKEFVEEKIKEKVRTFEIPTIAELQSRKNLKVGDIVEVLGYYTAGDGAGHKRIIANEDDGSGVQLKNGLWANIVHNGEVNVSWFGAKENEDSTQAVQKALDVLPNTKSTIIVDKPTTVGVINVKPYKTLTGNKLKAEQISMHQSSSLVNIELEPNNSLDNKPMILIDKKNLTTGKCDIAIDKIKVYGDTQDRDFLLLRNINETLTDSYGVWGLKISDIYGKVQFNTIIKFQCAKLKAHKSRSWITYCTIRDIRWWFYKKAIELLTFDADGIDGEYGYDTSSLTSLITQIVIDNCTFESTSTSETFCRFGNGCGEISVINSFSGDYIYSNTKKYYIFDTRGAYRIRNLDLHLLSEKSRYDNHYFTFLGKEIYLFEKNKFTFNDGKNNTGLLYKNLTINPSSVPGYLLIFAKINNSIPAHTAIPFVFTQAQYNNKSILDVPTLNLICNVSGIIDNIDFSTNLKTLNKLVILKDKDENRYIGVECYLNNNFGFITGAIINYYNNQYFYPKEYLNREKAIESGMIFVKEILANTGVTIANQTQQLNSIYMSEKMKQENVYDDYITYIDEKTAYDKKQEKLEQERQLAYQEALKENPDLTFEEFISIQPTNLNLIEEPQPSKALQDFMDKYL